MAKGKKKPLTLEELNKAHAEQKTTMNPEIAKQIDEKGKDPLVATVGENTSTKIKAGDGIADVMAKSAAHTAKARKGKDKTRKPGETPEGDIHPYDKAAETRKKSISELATEKLLSGDSIGKSLKGGIGDKMKAVKMGIKEKFDPLNIVKTLTFGSKFATAVAGKKMGRTNEDIEHFTGVKAPAPQVQEEPEEQQTATKVKGGGRGSMAKTNSILENIYQLMVKRFDESAKVEEVKKNFDEEHAKEDEKDKDKKQKEIVEALKGINGKKGPDKKEEKEGIFSKILGFFGKFLGMGAVIEGVIAAFSTLAGAILPVIAVAGALYLAFKGLQWLFGGKTAAEKPAGALTGARSANKVTAAQKMAAPIPNANATVTGASETPALLKASPTAPKQTKLTKVSSKIATKSENLGKAIAQNKTAAKIGKVGSKAGSMLSKGATKVAGKTASKVIGSTVKGAGKLLKFIRGIPGIGLIAAGADLIMRISDLNGDLESGKITKQEYKKGVVSAVAQVAGGAGGATLLGTIGAALGSVVPGIGTLIGGIGGGLLGYMAGEKVGGYVGEKLYDFAVDGKKDSASQQQTDTKKQTASPVSSKSASPEAQPKSEQEIYNQLVKDSPEEWKKDPSYLNDLKSEAHMQANAPTAIPQAAKPSSLGPRLNEAQKTNASLASDKASQPIIVNAQKTNVVNNKSSGGNNNSANVRNDESVLTRLQYQNARPV